LSVNALDDLHRHLLHRPLSRHLAGRLRIVRRRHRRRRRGHDVLLLFEQQQLDQLQQHGQLQQQLGRAGLHQARRLPGALQQVPGGELCVGEL
jgi:hypothetical protein